jgi:mono/diheme cytochrome c family protein
MSARIFLALLALAASANGIAAEPSAVDTLTEAQRQGRELFNESCVFCHDERGHATALLAKRLGEKNSVLERRANLSPELIRHVVRHGINSMPWYPRAELSDRELAMITAYLTRSNGAK